jgi:hypothetical protein
LEKGIRDALRALHTETAVYATRHVIEDLRARYHDLRAVLDYLAAVQADVTARADEFRKEKEQETPPGAAAASRRKAAGSLPGKCAGQ